MIFQKPKPAYSQEAINQQVVNIEKLHKLQDMCVQKVVRLRNSGNDSQAEEWTQTATRYGRNIESGQRYLTIMMDKNSRDKKSPPVREG